MKAGFTLVEVMVAVAVASLLIVGVTASAQATIRTAGRQKSDARAEEQRSRAIELFRQDWRGRVRVIPPMRPPPAGTQILRLSTTADSISSPSLRGVPLVTYEASENGLLRMEGSAALLILPAPVQMDFWDGVAWKAEPAGGKPAVRLVLQNPEETVVFR